MPQVDGTEVDGDVKSESYEDFVMPQNPAEW